jgi:glycine cleavage system H protein
MVAILVAFTFLGLVLTDFGVQKWNAWQTARSAERATRRAPAAPGVLWDVPEGVHLSEVHTWFRPDPTGGLEVGVDNLIAHALGAVGRIVLPKPGDHVTAGQPLFRLEKDGSALTVPSTVTGIVGSINATLQNVPALIHSDPYGKGWICRVIPTNIGAVTPPVRFGEKAILWLESEFSRLREFLSVQMPPEFALGATSQDGGLPVSGCLNDLPKPAWRKFEAEFLRVK